MNLLSGIYNGDGSWSMNRQYKKQYIILTVVFFLIVFGFIFTQNKPVQTSSENFQIPVYIADTPAERVKGLSGRTELPSNRGMLFVFEKDGKYSIWMKDMKFNIDVVWLNSDKIVVDSALNIGPETYPKNFASKVKARYILELPAGQVVARNISTGTQLSFATMID